MRFLLTAAVLSLVAGLSPVAPVRAELALIEVSPELALVVNDGRLAPDWREKLDQAEGTDLQKGILRFLLSDRNRLPSYFNLGSSLTLYAGDPGRHGLGGPESPAGRTAAVPGLGRLVIFYWRETAYGLNFSFDVVLDSPLESAEEFHKILESAEARLRIDGRPIEDGNWGLTGQEGSLREFVIHPVLFPVFEDAQKFNSRVLSALRGGRTVDMEVVSSGGRTFSAKFDLGGLDEALTLLDQKNAEIDRTMKRELRELRKRLAALEQGPQ